MAVITKEQLENASLDAADVGDFVNAAAGDVVPRIGGNYPNMRKLINQVLDGGGLRTFADETALQAYSPALPTLALTTTPIMAWLWDGSAPWVEAPEYFDAVGDYVVNKVQSPLVETAVNAHMQEVVKDIYVEGGLFGDRYLINFEDLSLGGGSGRVRFVVRDTLQNINVAQWLEIDTQVNFLARTDPTVLAWQDSLADYTGITATIWVDWAKLNFATNLTTYTDYADSGIKSDRVVSRDEIMRRFRAGAEPKMTLTVGTGTETDTHFNTFQGALERLYNPGYSVTRSGPYPLSFICSFSHQVLIEDVTGVDEQSILIAGDGIGGNQSKMVLPPFVTLRGRGWDKTRIYANDAGNTGPAMEAPFPFRVEKMTIENMQSGYAVHIDGVNGISKRAATGVSVLHYPLLSIAEDCVIKGSASTATWVIGTGIGNGHNLALVRTYVVCAGADGLLGIHNSPNETDAALIEAVDCNFNDAAFVGAKAFDLQKNIASTIQHDLVINNCDYASVAVSAPISGAAGYRKVGYIDPAKVTGTFA